MRVLFNLIATFCLFAVFIWVISFLDTHDAKQFSGRAVVVDGDSLVLNGKRLRLIGIDAPELAQICERSGVEWNCGRASRRALAQKIRNETTNCTSKGLDRYDRWLVVCSVDGDEINAWLVKQGWAVDYGGYASEEAEAIRHSTGIWSGEFEVPQEWRRANRGDTTDYKSGFESLKNWLIE